MLVFILSIVCVVDSGDLDRLTPNLIGIKCVVSGMSASEKYSCKFKEGRVYFDCNASRRKFLANKTGFIVKANHQLVATAQYSQVKCPVKRIAIKPEQGIKHNVAGIQVKFCCSACKQSLTTSVSIHEQIRMIFDNRTFNEVFQPVAKLSSAPSAVSKRR